jgi:GTP-binding protein
MQNPFQGEIQFIAGATKITNLPVYTLPEIGFIGKSNVGKSSLINMLTERKNLARVSHSPGRTQQINFFSVNDQFIIVDLPGYGFAKVPLALKQRWEKLIVYYLKKRENLKIINLLVDARRGLQSNDLEVIKFLSSYNINFQVVLTKIDKITQVENLYKITKKSLETLGHSCNLICTSSRSKQGAKEFQLSLEKYIA